MRPTLLLTLTTALFLTGCAAGRATPAAYQPPQWEFPIAMPSWAADEVRAEEAAARTPPVLELPPGPSARVRGGVITGPEAGPICDLLGLKNDAEMVLDEGCTKEVVALTNKQSWTPMMPPSIQVASDRVCVFVCGNSGQATRFVVSPSAIEQDAADVHFEFARLDARATGAAPPELWSVESHPRLESGQSLIRRIDPPDTQSPRLVFVQLVDTP
jgi:hypothetical protein